MKINNTEHARQTSFHPAVASLASYSPLPVSGDVCLFQGESEEKMFLVLFHVWSFAPILEENESLTFFLLLFK